jgi:acetyl esterase/lipase
MRVIAERAGITTYVVDYQLAPEAKYPVQIEEIEYVVRWLSGHAAGQGVDPAKIALGGDSAGGNMTCVVALKLRDEGGPHRRCGAARRRARRGRPSGLGPDSRGLAPDCRQAQVLG